MRLCQGLGFGVRTVCPESAGKSLLFCVAFGTVGPHWISLLMFLIIDFLLMITTIIIDLLLMITIIIVDILLMIYYHHY